MRLVFLDEAGISNPEHEPYMIVAAVIVDADKKLIAVQRHLDELVDRHIPPQYREGFVFHAAQIFNGGGKVFKNPIKNNPNPEWPIERRLAIAADLAAIPGKFELPIVYGAVDRAKWLRGFPMPEQTKVREREAMCHVTCFAICATHVDLWMRRNASNEVCLLVVEDNDNSRRLLREAHRFFQGNYPYLPDSPEGVFPLQRIKQDPLFEPKQKSSIIQVADFCSYVLIEDVHET